MADHARGRATSWDRQGQSSESPIAMMSLSMREVDEDHLRAGRCVHDWDGIEPIECLKCGRFKDLEDGINVRSHLHKPGLCYTDGDAAFTLWLAAREGRVADVDIALSSGACVHWVADCEFFNQDDDLEEVAVYYMNRPLACQALHAAAVHPDSEKATKHVLDCFANVTAVARSEDGVHVQPIHLAASTGCAATIEMLLCSKADPNAAALIDGGALHYPIHDAVRSNNIEKVRSLIRSRARVEAKDHDGNTALHVAVWLGHINVVKLLRKYSERTYSEKEVYRRMLYIKNLNGMTPGDLAAGNCIFQPSDLDLFIPNEDRSNNFKLWLAAREGRIVDADMLLQSGARFDWELQLEDEEALCYLSQPLNSEVLHAAAAFPDSGEVTKLVLDCFANVTAVARSEHGIHVQPIHLAASMGCAATIEMLLWSKADPNAAALIDGGALHYPIHDAARSNKVENVKFLLRVKASVEAKDRDGNSVLHLSAMHGQDCLDDILSACDTRARETLVRHKNNDGKTAFDFAIEHGKMLPRHFCLFFACLHGKQRLDRCAHTWSSAEPIRCEKCWRPQNEELLGSRDFVLTMVEQHGLALGHLSENYRRNHGVVLAAAAQNVEALQFATEAIWEDPEFIAALARQRKQLLSQATFWFVLAEKIRADTAKTLPPMQSLLEREGWLVKKDIDFGEALRGAYTKEFLSVSHRWESPREPDTTGTQLQVIRTFLRDNPQIKFVWFDFWCMPQGRRSRLERTEFRTMLRRINRLYLSTTVLILLDLSYMSRFWTQFEAWLSMQKAASDGLRPAAHGELRCQIVCIHNAPLAFETALYEMWKTRTVTQAHELLSRPDVTVTNKSDKDVQLPKLLELDAEVRTHLSVIVQPLGRNLHGRRDDFMLDPMVEQIYRTLDRHGNGTFHLNNLLSVLKSLDAIFEEDVCRLRELMEVAIVINSDDSEQRVDLRRFIQFIFGQSLQLESAANPIAVATSSTILLEQHEMDP